MNKKLRIGVIGLGNRGSNLLTTLLKMDDIIISAV